MFEKPKEIVGEGNFADSREELEVYSYVLSVGGAISSEHCMGRLRTKYMGEAHGRTLQLLKKIKTMINEDGTMNPGCLFD